MSGHIVRPFRHMLEHRVSIRHQARHEALHVAQHRRIGVLADHERGTGVVDEDMAQPSLYACGAHHASDLLGDVVNAALSSNFRESTLFHSCSEMPSLTKRTV